MCLLSLEWSGKEIRNKNDRKSTVAEMTREGWDANHTLPFQSFNF